MKQILSGVNYLHTNGIHRDLKLKNIVLKYENILDLQYKNLYKATVKIIDFDLCYISNINKPNSVVGTVPNMAPSIVYNINNKYPKYYNEKVDIWSLGTVCYEMLLGKPLFTKYMIKFLQLILKYLILYQKKQEIFLNACYKKMEIKD